jgi:hypothetical protein
LPVTDPMRRSTADSGPAAGANLALIASGAVLSAALFVSAWKLPIQLVLPTVSVAALATACAIGLVAWTSPAPNRRHPTCWDVCGALTFIGMCAAILSELDQVLPLLEVATRDD